MKHSENLLSGIVVKREIHHPTTSQAPTYYEELDGLPFYYNFDFSFAIILIVLGIGLLIVEIIVMGLGFILPFCLKKYICTKCKRISTHLNSPQKCNKCGGEVMLLDEYNKINNKNLS
uniref:Uncharacterized protein n=1 Tax=uncultured Candidatus Melainabacteria bacterium TaxID=2682970 RepID=A0A650EK20_9BACT|nr:hypothetical protein Melaina855_1790 [uncultured Candidatus Melainabacteria bacterium]